MVEVFVFLLVFFQAEKLKKEAHTIWRKLNRVLICLRYTMCNHLYILWLFDHLNFSLNVMS